MRITILAIGLALCLAGAGCSDPKSTKLPADVAQWDTLKPQLDKLSPEDRELFTGFAMRKAFKGTLLGAASGNTDGTTVGQAIENQRNFKAAYEKQEAEAAALKAKVKAEREVAIKALRDVVTVSLVSKKVEVERGYSGIEMDRKLVISVAYKNNGSKDIAGVKGMLIVRDLFGDELSSFHISNDDTMKVGGGTVWMGGRSLRFAMGNNKDAKFADLTDDKFKVTWEPEVIVFADGTKISADKSGQ